MFSPGRTIRRLVASFVTCAVVATPLLVPVLDRYSGEGRTVGAADAPLVATFGHDHALCIQVSTTLGVLASGVPGPGHGTEWPDASPRTPARTADRDASRAYLSRAPPGI